VIGQNWLMAIFNVFCNWNGNIAFGQPDLWVGGDADVDTTPLSAGSSIRIRYTIINNGDSSATDVRVRERMHSLLSFRGSETGGTYQNGFVDWLIPSLGPGETATVDYDAEVSGNLPIGSTIIENRVLAESFENDANMSDNADILTLGAENIPISIIRGPQYVFTPDPDISVTKTNSATGPIAASSTVDYHIVVKNNGGMAYRAALVDTIRDARGKKIFERVWALDTIYPDEEIKVNYTVLFGENTAPGIYTNYAEVKAIGRHPQIEPSFVGIIANSETATSSVEIIHEARETPYTFEIEAGKTLIHNTESPLSIVSLVPEPEEIEGEPVVYSDVAMVENMNDASSTVPAYIFEPCYAYACFADNRSITPESRGADLLAALHLTDTFNFLDGWREKASHIMHFTFNISGFSTTLLVPTLIFSFVARRSAARVSIKQISELER
ncbi:DUF11 domain-containing protein, partial [bacterium]|nr:DUF11 domain-containing protein [bacterium]